MNTTLTPHHHTHLNFESVVFVEEEQLARIVLASEVAVEINLRAKRNRFAEPKPSPHALVQIFLEFLRKIKIKNKNEREKMRGRKVSIPNGI